MIRTVIHISISHCFLSKRHSRHTRLHRIYGGFDGLQASCIYVRAINSTKDWLFVAYLAVVEDNCDFNESYHNSGMLAC